jgi:6-phosphogluconate dehydrogenase
MSNADVENLIELYRGEECLWDNSNGHYMDSDMRQAALGRIAAKLGNGITGGRYGFLFYNTCLQQEIHDGDVNVIKIHYTRKNNFV